MNWNHFKKLLAIGGVVYLLCIWQLILTAWDGGPDTESYVMGGYTLLLSLSLIINLLQSKNIFLRILSYILLALFIIFLFAYINMILYEYFKTGFYS